MKTITWNQFCDLIEDSRIQIEIDGIKPEIYYGDNGSIKFEWECDDLGFQYYVGGEDNESIPVDMNKAELKCRDENEKVSSMELYFYSVQPHNL